MVWIIDRKINKVRQVALGSSAMMDAKNVYTTEAEAKSALEASCTHPTRLGSSKTGFVFCADCGSPC